MTPELWQRLKPLYMDALETPVERRLQYVEDVCGTDAEMKKELNALLAENKNQTDTLDAPLIRLRDPYSAKEQLLTCGELILGRFRIMRHLGSGGMGDVYEANDIDLQLGRIALKTIRPAIAENPETLARFKEEVILARRVSGPHVCRIHELFVPPPQTAAKYGAFLTMEFLEGTTLSNRISEVGPLPLSEASMIITQLCTALQSIHEAGVIHRDLKPRNIMLVPHNGSEKVVVMDFGLARVLAREAQGAKTDITVPGVVMGTPDYMAPEQFEGRDVSPATDIYALGLILYELVTGKQPFATNTPLAAAVRRGKPLAPVSSIRREIPAAWDDVITRCLEYDAERRYQSANEVINALSEHRLVVWTFEQGRRITFTRRHLLSAFAVTLVLLAVVGWMWIRSERYRPPSPTVAYWYNLGMTALREGSYLKATRALDMATQIDEKFALAHAGLAEAWSELDFTRVAEREMLFASAPEQQRNLSPLDRKYIDAVRSTLIRDYSSAAQDYEAILKALPRDQKAQGYVDLGRVYEKAGRVRETIDSYVKATKLSPDQPAAFLHLGILKSRQRDAAGGETAFNRAETLYQASSNLEGLAEVYYQRGYAANEAAASDQAKAFLNRSLAIAGQIPSVQLEVRSLSQLSSLAYNDGHDDQAIDYANQVIQLARDNELEYWSTDGLMRLGNAYMDKEDFTNAESSLQQALRLAQQNQHPRLEAASELSLASIRDQQGKWDESISFAKGALKYYQDFGFMNSSAQASTLIVRGQRGKGDLTQALQSGKQLLQLAEQTDSRVSIELAEELVGSVSMDLEQYPSALDHFQQALRISQSLHENEAFQALHCAGVLWRLGRYQEADSMLASIAPDARKRTDIATDIELARSQIQESEGRSHEALATAGKALLAFPKLQPRMVAEFERVQILAEMRLGQFKPAQHDTEQLVALAHQQSDEELIAEVELVESEVNLSSHNPHAAMSQAQAARQYFASKGKKESEWLSLFYEAEAVKAIGDNHTSAKEAAQALDILGKIEQSWESSAFHSYTTRPDIQPVLHELAILRAN
jgi:tetratricopeptide (TPR) repeat protein